MLQREHSAIHSTFIKLPVVIKIFVLFIFEWPFYTGFTVHQEKCNQNKPVSDCLFCLKPASFKKSWQMQEKQANFQAKSNKELKSEPNDRVVASSSLTGALHCVLEQDTLILA